MISAKSYCKGFCFKWFRFVSLAFALLLSVLMLSSGGIYFISFLSYFCPLWYLYIYRRKQLKRCVTETSSPSFYSCHPSSPLLFPHSPLLPLFSCPLTLSHSSRLIIRAAPPSPLTYPRDEWILLCKTDRVAESLGSNPSKDFYVISVFFTLFVSLIFLV